MNDNGRETPWLVRPFEVCVVENMCRDRYGCIPTLFQLDYLLEIQSVAMDSDWLCPRVW